MPRPLHDRHAQPRVLGAVETRAPLWTVHGENSRVLARIFSRGQGWRGTPIGLLPSLGEEGIEANGEMPVEHQRRPRSATSLRRELTMATAAKGATTIAREIRQAIISELGPAFDTRGGRL